MHTYPKDCFLQMEKNDMELNAVDYSETRPCRNMLTLVSRAEMFEAWLPLTIG